MNRFAAVLALAAVAAALPQCNKMTRGTRPQLEVSIGSESSPTEYFFQSPEIGNTRQEVQVDLQNTGSEPLEISNVYLQEGGNPFITILWKEPFDGSGFPFDLEENSLTTFSFLVVYEADLQAVDITSSVLVIESDDPALEDEDGKYLITLRVEGKGPLLCVNIDAPAASSCLGQPTISYNCVSGCSTKSVYVGNDGTAVLTIKKIDRATASSEFTIENPPSLPIDIPPKGDPNYNPIVFVVRYCPGDDFWEDKNEIVIVTNDTSLPDGTKHIPVSVVQAPAMVSFSTDSPFGYFDFSAGDGTTHKVNIYNKSAAECDGLCPVKGQCCGCPVQLTGADVLPADAAAWYTIVPKDPLTGSPLSLPRALKGGAAMDFEVLYQKPAGKTEDRNGQMCLRYVSPLEGPQSYCVSMLAASQCEFSLAPSNWVLHFNSASPADVKEKPVVLINTGNAACPITHVSVTDKWEGASEDFSLKDVIPGDTQLAPFGLLPVWVKYSPHTDPPTGFLKVEYTDTVVGAAKATVTLNGTKEQDCVLPLANPGNPASYTSAPVGQAVILNGCSSGPGECGELPFENGFLWFLVAKPEGSAAWLNEEGPCMSSFVPDVAGDYTVGLIVYEGKTFHQSEIATLKVTAVAQ